MKLKIKKIKEKIRKKSLNIDFSRKWIDTSFHPPTFGVAAPSGYNKVTSKLGDLEEQLESLKKDKRIISLNVGCCDSGTGNSSYCFERVIQYLVDEKIKNHTYLFCDPSCDYPSCDYDEIVKKFGISNIGNNLIFKNYLSNKAGWSCGDARNIENRLLGLDFNENGNLENSNIKIYKINEKQIDLKILEDLFK